MHIVELLTSCTASLKDRLVLLKLSLSDSTGLLEIPNQWKTLTL